MKWTNGHEVRHLTLTGSGQSWYEEVAPDAPMLPDGDVGGRIMSIILSHLMLTAIVAALSTLVLSAMERSLYHVVWPVGAVWLSALALIHVTYKNAGKRVVIVIEQQSPDAIRYVRLSTGQNKVPLEDIGEFLRFVGRTGRYGKNAIRNLRFPSDAKGTDAYHDELTQALTEAGVWEPASGPGTSGKLLMDVDEALIHLGLEPPTEG